MKMIVENLAVEYQDQGHGPVILMLHGWKDSLRTFDALIPYLGRNWRVVRIDLPGFGGSEVPPTSWDVSKYAHFVDACIKKLGIDIEVLVGHSLGGRISIKGVGTGIFHPKKLVLIASAGVSHSTSLRSRAFNVIAKVGKVCALVLPRHVRDKLRRKLYRSAGSDYLESGELKESYLKIIHEDLQKFGKQIGIPTLLIWGKNDTAAPLADGEIWHRSIQNSKFVVLDDASHFVHQEKPETVAMAIENFIHQV